MTKKKDKDADLRYLKDTLEQKDRKIRSLTGQNSELKRMLDRSSERFHGAASDRDFTLDLLSEMLGDQATFFGKQTTKVITRLSRKTCFRCLDKAEKEEKNDEC